MQNGWYLIEDHWGLIEVPAREEPLAIKMFNVKQPKETLIAPNKTQSLDALKIIGRIGNNKVVALLDLIRIHNLISLQVM